MIESASACRRALARVGLACALLIGAVQAVSAQSAVCRSIQAELASLERGGSNPRAAREAQRYRAEVRQLAGYMSSIGCGRQRFLIFGSSAPPECGPLAARLRDTQAALAAAEAAGGDPRAGSQRRSDLMVALRSYNCDGAQAAPRQPGGFLSRLFGAEPSPRDGSLIVRPDEDLQSGVVDPLTPGSGTPGGPRGGSKAVCVRSCDGYFFPLDIAPGRARAQGDELCQALCPGAPSAVYFMTLGGDIENAVSASGQNYTALPSALHYRQAVEPGCTCKARTESWAKLLKPAEDLLGGDRRGDIVVTPEKSLELSRPILPAQGKGKPGAGGPPLAAANPAPDAQPTDGTADRYIEITNEDGSKRTIRVIPTPPRTKTN